MPPAPAPMDPVHAVLIALVAIPVALGTTVIGIPMAMQFAAGVSSRMSVNSANATEETSRASSQIEP